MEYPNDNMSGAVCNIPPGGRQKYLHNFFRFLQEFTEGGVEFGNFGQIEVDPQDEKIRAFQDKIMATARSLQKDMDELFCMTKWEKGYRKLYRELKMVIFDE